MKTHAESQRVMPKTPETDVATRETTVVFTDCERSGCILYMYCSLF